MFISGMEIRHLNMNPNSVDTFGVNWNADSINNKNPLGELDFNLMAGT